MFRVFPQDHLFFVAQYSNFIENQRNWCTLPEKLNKQIKNKIMLWGTQKNKKSRSGDLELAGWLAWLAWPAVGWLAGLASWAWLEWLQVSRPCVFFLYLTAYFFNFLFNRSAQSAGPFVFFMMRRPRLRTLATLTEPKIPENQLGIMAFFVSFLFLFVILVDDAKSVALYSAYA